MVVAISSRALFDLDDSHKVFVDEGLDSYASFQIEHEDEVLAPGVAFPLVKKLLGLNDLGNTTTRVEVILLSRNSGDTGLRIFNSIQHYKLDVVRAAFTNGLSPWRYIAPFGAHLFLSTDTADVKAALEAGYAAATILPGTAKQSPQEQLRIAFDGDAVLFSDESERIFKEKGLQAFSDNEHRSAMRPLAGGPFKPVLEAIHRIQSAHRAENNPIRTALVTARSAPAHKRVILTLREWGIRIDEALFLGGRDKAAFLKAFAADIFFDDQVSHCRSSATEVATGHVPHGVANE